MFVACSAINADDRGINRVIMALASLFLPPRTGQTLWCVNTAKLTCIHMQHGKS